MFDLLSALDFLSFGFYPDIDKWRLVLAIVIIPMHAVLTVFCVKNRYRLSYCLVLTLGLQMLTLWLCIGDGAILRSVKLDELSGLCLNLLLAYWSIPLATILAAGICFILINASSKSLAYILGLFFDLIRSLPLVTLLFFNTLILPMLFNPKLIITRLEAAWITLIFFLCAYTIQIFLGAYEAISYHQHESAKALGISGWKKYRHIDLPQMLKHSLPALISTYIGMIKDTTLVMIIGLADSLGNLQLLISRNAYKHYYIEFFFILGFLFWLTCTLCGWWGKQLERTSNYGKT